ncbi:hypothetical protein EYF80_003548 [Liparis tanakae]|uniref:Uncharacterized protein n=1 Tax=Liparis tanakae TaxID=230148 RepID=A0A4Z2J898_9TELE|nr:hypothetical protein EYF80_003548 [Liparis tanakae]
MAVEAAASSGETLLCDGPWTACEGEEEILMQVRGTDMTITCRALGSQSKFFCRAPEYLQFINESAGDGDAGTESSGDEADV